MPNARPLLAAVFGLAAAAATLPAQQHDYVVLAACADGDAFDRAARHLERHHRALLLRFDPGELAGVAEALAAAAPRHVALVMRPEQIDFGFQRRFLQLATRIDDDPFVDFAFGYITGATGDEALALAERGTARQPKVGTPRFAGVAGGVDRSRQFDVPVPMGKVVVRQLGIHSAGEQAFPDEGRDRAFLAEHLPKLEGCDVVTFIGHGYPHEVHGGPDHRDIRGLRLPGAVALNVACYTGTTDRWYDRDHRRARIVAKRVPGEQSFCLELLRSGVVGYTAYVCPRPAGPELDTDRTALVFDGATLGEARRRDYDKTVLGFLGFGEERLALDDVHDGAKVPRAIDPIRDLMLEGATGGALFGDPACRPFAGMPDKSPVRVAVEAADEAGDEHVTVRVKGDAGVLWTHFSDPTARWGDSMAMKVHARVPLGDRHATGVEVRELRVGRKVVPTRLLWAVEEDHGERFVQVRVNFERSLKVRGVLSCTVRVATTADASQAVRRGGEVQRPQRGGAGNQAPPKGDPFVLAAERD
ncbi:MAG: hypothetical protein KAI24_25620, partial [Planctomycetes bacterium]|nr:hypothetical protein [Planctomycetota bacterium]